MSSPTAQGDRPRLPWWAMPSSALLAPARRFTSFQEARTWAARMSSRFMLAYVVVLVSATGLALRRFPVDPETPDRRRNAS